ncbi:MAG: hypothetical protein NT040_18100 [Bacteroidetes bacterium]|nr:hypothetical protein [Bacteroidota bacterium]
MIKLTHEWSELDQVHQFGIELSDEPQNDAAFNWVWFHLGSLTKDRPVAIYPYRVGKVLTSYQLNDARKTAGNIYNRMVKEIQNHTN